MLKKQIIIQKGLNILTENPIILLYHFNNVSTNHWYFIKNEIQKVENINNLVLQNKITTKILDKIELRSFNFEKSKKLADLHSLSESIKDSASFPKSEQKNNQLLTTTRKKLKFLFQGPTILLGCKTSDQLVLIYNVFKNSSHFVYIGGFYNDQNISHYSLNKILELNESNIIDLLQFLESKKIDILFFNPYVVSNYGNLLELLDISKKKRTVNKTD